MGLLEGKNALIFGLANDKSIAWGITQAFKREGANIGISYAGEILERRVKPLAEQVGCKWVEECDVTKDDAIAATVEKAAKHFGKIDVLVHSVAFAGRDELSRPFHETSREGFKNALEISAFSLVALTHDQPRGIQERVGDQRIFTGGIDPCFSAADEPWRVCHVPDLLRVGEGCAVLQCDGRGKSRVGIVHPIFGV